MRVHVLQLTYIHSHTETNTQTQIIGGKQAQEAERDRMNADK